jgi:hypothetical protein
MNNGRHLHLEPDSGNDLHMSATVELTVPMPAKLAELRLPKALDDRLQFLLDEQNRRGKLTAAEKREAAGLVNVAATLSILKLGAQLKARQR